MKMTFAPLALVFLVAAPHAAESVDCIMSRFPKDSRPVQCNIGPAKKSFGGKPWLVYACRDSKSIAIVSAPENPAVLFYFIVHVGSSKVKINTVGTPVKGITDITYQELRALSLIDFESLGEEARGIKPEEPKC